MGVASFRHAVFQIGFNRGKPALQALLGGKPRGIYGSDRWWAYTLIPPSLRQLCWAHLKRDLQRIAEREGHIFATRLWQRTPAPLAGLGIMMDDIL